MKRANRTAVRETAEFHPDISSALSLSCALFDATQNDARAVEILEPQHRPSDAFDGAMVLLNNIVKVLHLTRLKSGLQRVYPRRCMSSSTSILPESLFFIARLCFRSFPMVPPIGIHAHITARVGRATETHFAPRAGMRVVSAAHVVEDAPAENKVRWHALPGGSFQFAALYLR